MFILEALAQFFGTAMPPLLIATGLGFGAVTGFFYIRHPLKTARAMLRRRGDGISPLRAASMALAGTLGVGNITGVTAAIAMGGAGAVFWMWFSAVAAMSVKYAETALAVRYRRRDRQGYYGGAPFYIRDGLGKRFPRASAAMGGAFAVFCIINSLVVGNILQVNAAASAVKVTFGIPSIAVGVAVAAATAAVVLGGAGRISSLTVKLIPLVSAVYIIMCAAVILSNADMLPAVVTRIFKEAFSFSSALGGACGYGISAAVRYGVTRGILTNEAGSGTSPTAHACADAESPMAQGCLGIFEVFADTIVICSMTAFVILIGEEYGILASAEAIDSSFTVFSFLLGEWASGALTAVIFVFVLATLMSQHYYGEVAARFFGGGRRLKRAYTALYLIAVVYGSVIAPELMWTLSDITVGVLTTVNVLALIFLRREVISLTDTSFGRGK